MKNYEGHPDQHFGPVTYAQHGDDLMILNLFKLMGIEKPSYLDLGAHHPVTISNTALLYERGSRGVNVEANPALIDEFERLRPGDKNVNIGVGPNLAPSMKFFKYSETSGRNTFSQEEVDSLKGVLTVKEEVFLSVMTLQEIVKLYCDGIFPDLLTCDIEGFDYDVLSQLPPASVYMANVPKLIVVETRRGQSDRMTRLMRSKGYFPYCRMGENLFFVRNDYMGKVY